MNHVAGEREKDRGILKPTSSRSMRMKRFLLFLPFFATMLDAQGLPPLIDRELLFGNPEISGAQISPDGKYLFFTSNRGTLDKPLLRRLEYDELIKALRSPGNGLRDVYQVDVSAVGLEKRSVGVPSSIHLESSGGTH